MLDGAFFVKNFRVFAKKKIEYWFQHPLFLLVSVVVWQVIWQREILRFAQNDGVMPESKAHTVDEQTR